MQRYSRREREAFFFLIKLLLMMLVFTGISAPVTAHAMVRIKRVSPACLAAGAVTSQSLLVVLLDRSGSLILQPGATDPNGYSTSVTKALADLWPGIMAVIPFSGDTTSLPILGPATLSDPTQQADLKNKVENYPIGGNTPLAPAMHEALALLQKAAPGSRAIIVTDGNPTGLGNNDGPHQEQDIRNNLIPKFCKLGIPVSAFGLTIDTTTSDGRDATKLLTDITTGTNTLYQNVTKPEDLARTVIKLYAEWLGLTFNEKTVQGGNASFAVDTSAKQVTILTFRSGDSTPVTLDGPDGRALPNAQLSQDRHYIIDRLDSGSGALVTGTYTVHTSNDQDVQVYALVNSTLQVQIIQPTANQQFSNNTPITIEAKFVDNGSDKQPAVGEATIFALANLFVNGKQVSSIKVPLQQLPNSPIFKGQTAAFGKNGTLQIEIDGNDQGLQRQASTSIRLITPPVPPPPPPPPCKLGFWGCLVQQVNTFYRQHQTLLDIGVPLIFLLLLLLFLFLRKGPQGTLKQDRNEQNLGTMRRPFLRWLLHKSTISSQELEVYGNFNFCDAKFDLIFGSGGPRIRARSKQPAIMVKKGNQNQKVAPDDSHGVELSSNNAIIVPSCKPATFVENTGS